ncbi:hypothetical protein L3Q82_016763, partial [Scortum barcoo]
ALVESSNGVSGYLGDNITLPSGAKSPGNLSTIQWSIFPNTTWIATYDNGKKNINRIDRYKGRLSLDTTSGNLTIHNLTAKDSMEYSVYLFPNEQGSTTKIYLTVTERLQKPAIQTTSYPRANGDCLMKLKCSSPNPDVVFSWQFKPPSVTVFERSGHDNNSSLLVHLSTKQMRVEITCISTRKMETASEVITLQCPEDKPKPQPQPQPQLQRCRETAAFFGGVILALIVMAIFTFFFSGEKKTASS